MKYFYIFLVSILLPFSASADAVISLDDNTVTIDQNIGVTVDCDLADTNRIYFFAPDGATVSDISCNAGVEYYFDNYIINSGLTSWMGTPNQLGTYTFLYVPSPDEYPTCITFDGSTNDYAACLLEFPGAYVLNTLTVVEDTPEPPSNPFAAVVAEGDTVMTTVTGENMQANVSYAGDTFYKPFIGAGLSVLYYIRYWVVALVIIGLIVFFYRRVKLNRV